MVLFDHIFMVLFGFFEFRLGNGEIAFCNMGKKKVN